MSGDQFDVQYEALERAIPPHAEASSDIRKIKSDAMGATLPSGAFGKLPQAVELERSFGQRHAAAVEALDNLIEAYDNIFEGLTLTLEQYRAADEAVEDQMSRLERLI